MKGIENENENEKKGKERKKEKGNLMKKEGKMVSEKERKVRKERGTFLPIGDNKNKQRVRQPALACWYCVHTTLGVCACTPCVGR